MALLFCDSFDHSTNPLPKLTDFSAGQAPTTAAGGRWSSRGLSLATDSDGGQSAGIQHVLASAASEVIAGMSNNGAAGTGCILGMAASAGGAPIAFVYLVGTSLVLSLGGSMTTPSAGTTLYSATISGEHYYELRVKIGTSDGEVELRVDGSVVYSGTGLNCGSSNIAAVMSRAQGGTFNGGPVNDDFYVLDTAGSVNNDFLGDVRVQCLVPSGNGATSDFVGSDADSTDNYLLVDETNPDSDTTYVESATGGDKDTYVYGDLASPQGTVHAVQVMTYAKKSDAGDRRIKQVSRLAGVDELGAEHILTTSYSYYRHLFEDDPSGSPWTITNANGAEFGTQVVS